MEPRHVALKLNLRFYKFGQVYVFYLATLDFFKETLKTKIITSSWAEYFYSLDSSSLLEVYISH